MQHLKKLAHFITAALLFIAFEYILIDALVIKGYFQSTALNIITLLLLTWMLFIYFLGHLYHNTAKPTQ